MGSVRTSASPAFTGGMLKSNIIVFPRSKAIVTPYGTAMSLMCPAKRTVKLAATSKTRVLVRYKMSAIGVGNRKFRALMGRKRRMATRRTLVEFSVSLIGGRKCSPRVLIVFARLPRKGAVGARRGRVTGGSGVTRVIWKWNKRRRVGGRACLARCPGRRDVERGMGGSGGELRFRVVPPAN